MHPLRAMILPVKRSLLLSASVASVLVASQALAGPPSTAPLPSLPGAGDPAGAPAGSAATPRDASAPGGAPLSPQQLYEHIRRGIVAIERNGVPLALGTVLDGDGRILTSWSGLNGADAADVRYADGSTAHTKVGNSDKVTDLALLVPQTGKWTEGLSASETDPVGAPLRAILPGHGPRLAPTEVGVKGRVDAHARDGTPINRLLDIDVKGPVVAGAPLFDAAGSVVGVLVRECKGPAAAAQSPAMPWAAWATSQDPAEKADGGAVHRDGGRRARSPGRDPVRSSRRPRPRPSRPHPGSVSEESGATAAPSTAFVSWRSLRRAPRRRPACVPTPTSSSRPTGAPSTPPRRSGTRSESTRPATP